jgi:hypothetical protein
MFGRFHTIIDLINAFLQVISINVSCVGWRREPPKKSLMPPETIYPCLVDVVKYMWDDDSELTYSCTHT